MKALALVDAPDHVCCRYRIRAFQPTLARAGWALSIESLAAGPIARARQLKRASDFDLVLLQRKLLPAWQFHILRRNARRLIFDFDDAVIYRDSYDPRGPHCPRRAARFARTVHQADAIIAGNAFLAQCARDAGASQVFTVPTCVEPEHYETSTRVRSGTIPPVDLVWIGSASTLQGLERQRPLLERLGRELPNLRLRLICDTFADFAPLKVLPIRWDEASEADDLAAADIGISWIPDDLWSRGKCGLKVLQYQAAALPVVANAVGVHPEMIDHGVSGFLADTPDQWVKSIRSLSENKELRERMGNHARANVVARYSVGAWSGTVLEIFGRTANKRRVA